MEWHSIVSIFNVLHNLALFCVFFFILMILTLLTDILIAHLMCFEDRQIFIAFRFVSKAMLIVCFCFALFLYFHYKVTNRLRNKLFVLSVFLFWMNRFRDKARKEWWQLGLGMPKIIWLVFYLLIFIKMMTEACILFDVPCTRSILPIFIVLVSFF